MTAALAEIDRLRAVCADAEAPWDYLARSPLIEAAKAAVAALNANPVIGMTWQHRVRMDGKTCLIERRAK